MNPPRQTDAASRWLEASPVRRRVLFVVILLVHAAVGLYFLQFHRHNLNPDAISYLSIAQKYRAGNFADAINGYWSPLFSWLLAPFVSSAWSPALVSKLVSLAASGALIAAVRSLSYRFAMTEVVRAALLLAMSPVAVYMALRDRTPDMLVVTTLLFYLSVIIDDGYRRTTRGWACGVLGALSYFAKSFGLAFFLVHFIAFNGLHWWRSETPLERTRVLKNCLSGLVVFAIISGAWIAALSAKYDGLTVAAAGRFNLTTLPESGYPHNRMLLPPPNPTATSYWEDPHLAIRDLPLGPRPRPIAGVAGHHSPRSPETRPHWVQRKLRRWLGVVQSFSVFSVAVLIGAAWLARPWAPRSAMRNRAQDVLLTLAVYFGGYSAVGIETRYLWVAWPLVMIVGFHLASNVLALRNSLAVHVPVALSMLAFAVSCWAEPWDFLQRQKEPAGANPEQALQSIRESGVHGRIASDAEWGRTLGMAFRNQWQYYGITGQGKDGRDVRRELAEHDIDYYFVWTPDFDVGDDWKQVPSGRYRRLRIYSLKEPRQ